MYLDFSVLKKTTEGFRGGLLGAVQCQKISSAMPSASASNQLCYGENFGCLSVVKPAFAPTAKLPWSVTAVTVQPDRF